MVEIPTTQTQRKVAELLHDIGCADKPTTHDPGEPEKCLDWPSYVTNSAFFLGRLMPNIAMEMFPAVRADERDKVAYHITAELVCCDIFARMEAAGQADDTAKVSARDPNSQWHQLRHGPNYHPMCRYGGWAASLAYHGPQLDQRHEDWFKPWLVNGTVEAPKAPYLCKEVGGEAECKPVYWCPTQGEYESPCHGGFDVCCRRPELHRESK